VTIVGHGAGKRQSDTRNSCNVAKKQQKIHSTQFRISPGPKKLRINAS
jgi:hypothetical protein